MRTSINSNIQKKITQIKQEKNKLRQTLSKIQERATIEAIRKAADLTPPNKSTGPRGTGTITGTMKAAWNRDSITQAIRQNEKYITYLNNNERYASFVDEGHRLTPHFTNKIMINPHSGLIEKVPEGEKGGLFVGTKTSYIPGLNIVDNAIKVYNTTVEQEADKYLKEVLGDGQSE